MGIEEYLRRSIAERKIAIRLFIIAESIDVSALSKQILWADHDDIGGRKICIILTLMQHLLIDHALVVASPLLLVSAAFQLHFHIKNLSVNLGINVKSNTFAAHGAQKGRLRRVLLNSCEIQLRKDPLHEPKKNIRIAHDAGKDIVIPDTGLRPPLVQNLLLLIGCCECYRAVAAVCHLCLLHKA